MPRLLFEKTGNAVWISHLDLMRLFQRTFKRAELPLKHTQGFNPRPSVSIALPLSVGVESQCELLDFELVECPVTNAQILQRLNEKLVDGIKVLDVYDNGRKTGLFSLLNCQILLEYDKGLPDGVCDRLAALFSTDKLIVPKKTKSGIQEQDIIPMVRQISVTETGEKAVIIDALICCQNPTLNPAQLTAAIDRYLPDDSADAVSYRRLEIYDNSEMIFR